MPVPAVPFPEKGDGVTAPMTFSEIGAELGVTRQRAEQIYWAAIRKVRRNPSRYQKLIDLADQLQSERNARLEAPHVQAAKERIRSRA